MFGAILSAGYIETYAIGTITTAGSLGILISPSIGMIIYRAKHWKTFYCKNFTWGINRKYAYACCIYWGKRLGVKPIKPASWKERWEKFKEAFWALMTIVIIIGGIYGGIFTPTEVAAVSAIWAFLYLFSFIKI